MGNFKSKNTEYSIIEDEVYATHEELTTTNDFPCPMNALSRFTGYGDTLDQSIKSLTDNCKYHGVPIPKIYPSVDKDTTKLPTNFLSNEEGAIYKLTDYYCGYIYIRYGWTDNLIKKRLNPLFCKQQNNRYLVYTYYNKM